MATLRPYKQLSLLSLVSRLQGDRGLLPLYLAVTLFELPPSAARSRATQPPTRHRGLGSARSRPRAARRARRSARLGAPAEARAPRRAVRPGNRAPAPPFPVPAAPRRRRLQGRRPGRGSQGWERAQIWELCAGGFISSPLGCEWHPLTFLRPVPLSRPQSVGSGARGQV